MPPRKTTTAPRRTAATPSVPTSGAAVRLPDGGDAVFVTQDDVFALVRVGTGHPAPVRVPLVDLEPVDAASETERHAKFRADALRRGEIG